MSLEGIQLGVVEYTPRIGSAYGSGASQTIKFHYLVKGKGYIEESNGYVPKENGPKEGSHFMAIYLPDEPENCALLLDYPVKDSSDFNRYVEEFKTNPPKSFTTK